MDRMQINGARWADESKRNEWYGTAWTKQSGIEKVYQLINR